MDFPKAFAWGCATSSYQVEGAAFEDGKGRSIWDDFCRRNEKVFEGHTGDITCDHYHRFKEDVAIMREIGINAYRFSVSWPRVMQMAREQLMKKGSIFTKGLSIPYWKTE